MMGGNFTGLTRSVTAEENKLQEEPEDRKRVETWEKGLPVWARYKQAMCSIAEPFESDTNHVAVVDDQTFNLSRGF
jgi:hypothetical protein